MNRLHSRRKRQLERSSKELTKGTGKAEKWEDRIVLANLEKALVSSLWWNWHSLHSWCFHSTTPIWPFHLFCSSSFIKESRVGFMHWKNNVELGDYLSSRALWSIHILTTFSWVSTHTFSLRNLPHYIEVSVCFDCFTILRKGRKCPPHLPQPTEGKSAGLNLTFHHPSDCGLNLPPLPSLGWRHCPLLNQFRLLTSSQSTFYLISPGNSSVSILWSPDECKEAHVFSAFQAFLELWVNYV